MSFASQGHAPQVGAQVAEDDAEAESRRFLDLRLDVDLRLLIHRVKGVVLFPCCRAEPLLRAPLRDQDFLLEIEKLP